MVQRFGEWTTCSFQLSIQLAFTCISYQTIREHACVFIVSKFALQMNSNVRVRCATYMVTISSYVGAAEVDLTVAQGLIVLRYTSSSRVRGRLANAAVEDSSFHSSLHQLS